VFQLPRKRPNTWNRNSVPTQNWIARPESSSQAASAAAAAAAALHLLHLSLTNLPGIPRHHAVAALCRCSHPFRILPIHQLPPAQGIACHRAVAFFFFFGA
jgi:hypothetical protein